MVQRMVCLDRLKVFLTVLVVLHHSSIVYGGSGGWFYYEHQDDIAANALLSTFTGVNQTFFMGLFFFVSGYVTPASYDRRGAGRFLKARLYRFGVPLICYMLLIAPLLRYVSIGYEGSFGEYLRTEVLSNPLRGAIDFSIGPLWYLFALLLFFAGYIGFRKLAESRGVSKPPVALTFRVTVVYLAAVMVANFAIRLVFPVGTEVLNLQLGYFPAYIGLFMAGVAAYRGGWLQQLKETTAKKWKWANIVMIVLFPAGMAAGGALDGDVSAFMGGMSWQAVFYAIIDPLLGLGISYSLLVGFRDRRNGSATKMTHWLSANAFTAFIIHAPIVTYTAFALRDLSWHPLLKFGLVGCTSVVLSFAISSLIRESSRVFTKIPLGPRGKVRHSSN
ncbi:acyltransferase family protein [Cohnella terricola]|uniref:Acyltransferase n=1 Tax=Cohnella terricola TaxID=1289167 RepID=A0A559JNM9_9BACL|nr:acyltransferase [Cohnella terricola]TVY01448.1 acyltransferase [Cohnella terricola]